jgi:V/A-type H+-transporting ATPase subunit A
MSQARIRRLSGPLLRAEAEEPFALHEAVRVGTQGLLGEVIRLDGTEITAQVYEDTSGLTFGDLVTGDGQPLAVSLGPGLLGGIFDGLLRPLSGLDTPFIPVGARQRAPGLYSFEPHLSPGERVAEGQPLGRVLPRAAREQLCLVPPGTAGEVRWIATAGDHAEDEVICRLVTAQGEAALTLGQRWPVRQARPFHRRLAMGEPLVTGQRVIDSLFPVALGGRAAIPGGFGTGKTVLLESLAKWCSADIIVYLGCGERGNELTGLLEEFPRLEDPGTRQPLMRRTVVIANTSNMPVAAREASVYTAMTVAEYFRDQGLHVALMADSTSRWAEALRELSGRLGELPGESGYPAYLSTRLAAFYERAGKVLTLNGDLGSVTLLGTVSPPSGDLSEPVVTHTKRFVRSFWTLDSRRAQARIYPAIDPLLSYSEDAGLLADWWRGQGNTQWPELRRRMLTLLQEQVKLERMARIIGRNALAPAQQVGLLCAELVTEAFLRQSAFSEADRYASPQRQSWMMRLLHRFEELARAAVGLGLAPAQIAALPVLRRLQRMGEEIAEDDWQGFDELARDLEHAFHALGRQNLARSDLDPEADDLAD